MSERCSSSRKSIAAPGAERAMAALLEEEEAEATKKKDKEKKKKDKKAKKEKKKPEPSRIQYESEGDADAEPVRAPCSLMVSSTVTPQAY